MIVIPKTDVYQLLTDLDDFLTELMNNPFMEKDVQNRSITLDVRVQHALDELGGFDRPDPVIDTEA